MTGRQPGRWRGTLIRSGLLALLFAVAGATSAWAQLDASFGGRQSLSSTAYYYISKAGEITMPVNLWGAVKNPGRYEIPISTDLVELLSFAGGPTGNATMDEVRIIRTVRRDNLMRKVEFVVNLDEMQKLDEKALDLEPGDTVIMEGAEMTFRDYALVISTVAAVTAAIASMINVMN